MLLCLLILCSAADNYWGAVDSDLTNVFYPWQIFVHRWFSRGIFPFWDPHVFSGYPTVETQQMIALNPVRLASLYMPPHWGLAFQMAAHTVIACAGMAFGLRRWGKTTAMAAALGAVLYVSGALFAVRVVAGHFTVVAAMAWWPLAALSLLRIARISPQVGIAWKPSGVLTVLANMPWSKMPWSLLSACALFHAMVILAGGPQYVAYLFYIDAAIVLASARRRNFISVVLGAGVVWTLALVISAPQWVPTLWYLPFTGRATSSGGAAAFSLQPLMNLWLEFIMPYPFGDDVTRGHLHFKNVWETASYPGTLTIILTAALLLRLIMQSLGQAAQRRRRPFHLSPLGAAGVFVLLLGSYMMVGAWLPGFGGFREAVKARAVIAFALALLAAATADAVVRCPARWRMPLAAGAALALAMLGIASRYAAPEKFLALLQDFGMPMDPRAIPDYNAALSDPAAAIDAYLASLSVAAGIASAAVMIIIIMKRSPRAALLMIVLLAMGDPLFHHAGGWLARHPWSKVGIPPAVETYFKPHVAKITAGDELPFRVILHSGIINRTHHLEGLYESYGYDPLMPAYAVGRMRVPGAAGLQDSGEADWRRPLMERAGIRIDASQWRPADAAETGPEPALPNIITAGNANLFDVSRNVVTGSPGDSMFGPDLSGRHYVLPGWKGGHLSAEPRIPEYFSQEIAQAFPPRDFPTSSPSTLLPGESIFPVKAERPDEWPVRVSLNSPALVVMKMTWLPGWQVGIDAGDGPKWQRALFANNWMVATIAPPGDSIITFRYRPVGWTPSLLIATLGMAAAIALALAGWKTKSFASGHGQARRPR